MCTIAYGARCVVNVRFDMRDKQQINATEIKSRISTNLTLFFIAT